MFDYHEFSIPTMHKGTSGIKHHPLIENGENGSPDIYDAGCGPISVSGDV